VIIAQNVPVPTTRNTTDNLRLPKNLLRVFDFLRWGNFDNTILKCGCIARSNVVRVSISICQGMRTGHMQSKNPICIVFLTRSQR